MSKVLVIPDLHAPFTKEGFLEFCKDTALAFGTDRTVFIGDVADNHMASRWAKEMEARGCEDELEEAYRVIQSFYAAFPEALVCIGNHDERPRKRAAEAFLGDKFIRDYSEVWDTPGWEWSYDHEIDGVLYLHGINSTGKDAALNLALRKRRSVVQGHTHSFAGVKYHANEEDIIFGLNVGWGGDQEQYAMAYSKHSKDKGVLGCGVVFDGRWAHFEPMELGQKRRPPIRKKRYKKRGGR